MSIDSEILPVAQVEELVRALVRALRAFQMYLPNNPMYQRAQHQLEAAFPPVWAVLDELTLLVNETDLVWEDHVVYQQPTKSESFAWGLYKDGMRLITLRKGVEGEEISRFLETVTRARHLAADASDDLLTLLWEQDFQRLTYQFAEVISDPWVYDPQALEMEARESRTTVLERVRLEAAAARPQGVIDPDDFDSTLYFLEEAEIAALRQQVEQEYARDVRGAALAALFDTFELQSDPQVREEILTVLEILFPNLLVRGDFRTVAMVLRELRQAKTRSEGLDGTFRKRLDGFEHRLSEPATIGQLLQTLDEAHTLPPEEDLGEVLRELHAPALGTILTQLPRLNSPEVRIIIGAAAERLAQANTPELQRLLRELDVEALPGAVRLAGRLGIQSVIPNVAELVQHEVSAVRLAAVEILGQLGTPGAMAGLEPAIDDPDRTVRMAAVAAVTKRVYNGALRRLEAAVNGKGPQRERAELRALFEAYAVVAGHGALPALRSIVAPRGLFQRKASTETRTCAVYALARLRTADARQLVQEAVADKELSVRHAATTLLREWPE
jgi:HEAT repeat protein